MGGRRFVVGVELMLGLAVGAAAAASMAMLIVVFLESGRVADERAARGAQAAEALAMIGGEGLVGDSALRAFTASGLVEDALLLGPGAEPPSGEGWTLRTLPGGRVLAVAGPEQPITPSPALTALLGAITLLLLLLAVTAPRYLSRHITEPLRALLAEAGRVEAAGSSSALAARASFGRLVEMLAQRDSELASLRMLAETRADMAEQHSGAVVKAVSSALFATDRNGRLLSFNPAAADLLGLDGGDEGNPLPLDRTPAAAALSGACGPEPCDCERTFRDPDGSEHVLGISAGVAGEGIRAFLVTDLTRIRALERRLAEEAAMAGLGTAAAGIAHEMGNTLCAMSGFIDLLARGQPPERARGLISEARSEVESARRMIDSFRLLASVPDIPGALLELSELPELLDPLARQVGPATVRCTAFGGAVAIDRELLARAVLNLARNAREASPGDEVEIVAETSGGTLSISVLDRGPGLPGDPAELLRPFRSGRSGQGHMGLGLTITRRIAMASGGSLHASDRQGGGAVFTIRLPLAAREAE
jgi:signal transduction histidine kinase